MNPQRKQQPKKPRPEALYAVGRVVKAFGIRGEMVVEPLTSDPSRFRSLQQVLVGRTEEAAESRMIDGMSSDGRGIRVSLNGVTSRNEAEGLVGCYLFVRAEERVPLGADSYYVDQVIGLSVRTEDGTDLGFVRDVLKLPAQDVYVVEGRGKPVMIPAVREFVLRIDLQNGVMVVKVIEGLTEE